jgi:hypothetical protein
MITLVTNMDTPPHQNTSSQQDLLVLLRGITTQPAAEKYRIQIDELIEQSAHIQTVEEENRRLKEEVGSDADAVVKDLP